MEKKTLAEKEQALRIELQRIIDRPRPARKPGARTGEWERCRENAIRQLREMNQPGYVYEDPDDGIPY